MVRSPRLYQSPRTTVDKTFPYTQYYIGTRDNEGRKSGDGRNYWTGAESLEWYTGRFLCDTMHGLGDYRWRYRGPGGAYVTYEGHFYANHIHGYGMMSYPDGRVFNGLFHKNIRWGPGVESHMSLNENVGLWRGTQLIRLTWRPPAPSIAFDLKSTCSGRAFLDDHRTLLLTTLKTTGKTNSALELLKQNGAQPMVAVDKWKKLYPKYCTDLESALCHINDFNCSYYNGKMVALGELSHLPVKERNSDGGQRKSDNDEVIQIYYAWNNNPMTIHMMKHCFKHEQQREKFGIELKTILSGPRRSFKPAGKHELDCRTLLMASYLGHITNVAQLVNDCNVYPNICDSQGNTAIMYAVCGNQFDIVHFLIEAGADVNSFNDSCCTALGLALLQYLCTEKNIPAVTVTQASLPSSMIPFPSPKEVHVLEWNMLQGLPQAIQTGGVTRSPSKIYKKIKPSMTIKDESNPKKKVEGLIRNPEFKDNESVESNSEEKKLYYNINNEYIIRQNDLFEPNGSNTIAYLFEVNDMIKELNMNEEDSKKFPEKGPKKALSKPLKDVKKPSIDMTWQNNEKTDYISIDSANKLKRDTLSQIMLTILQLLSDGADPRLVRCPQPAIFIAIMSGCSELVRHLTKYGADVNETYPKTFKYTALDVAISLPFTFESVEIIQALLDCGANADHCLPYCDSEMNVIHQDTSGPTLLHVVLTRKVDNDTEEELRREVIHFLLEHKCNSTRQFKGRSAIDIAMSKSMDVFDIFIKSPNTDLNAVINSSNQTILVKMFTEPFCNSILSSERLQTITNLLLFGADPLLECQNGVEIYENLFVFARKTYREMEISHTKPSGTASKNDTKGKKPDKTKKVDKQLTKSVGKISSNEIEDYRQAMDLAKECTRLLHIRWLQSKIVKELIEIVKKYKHRQWNMILKEYKNKKCTGLWVTTVRCLEIWDILKTVKYRFYNDRRILKYSLYIVHFCNMRLNRKLQGPRYMTAQEKDLVESEVYNIHKEYKTATSLSSEMMSLKRPYITPELQVRAVDKYNICFECALPFEEQKIICISCKLISFCSIDCLKTNLDRMNCHPCSNSIREIYFPNLDDDYI